MSGGLDLNPSSFTPGVCNLIYKLRRWYFHTLSLCKVFFEDEVWGLWKHFANYKILCRCSLLISSIFSPMMFLSWNVGCGVFRDEVGGWESIAMPTFFPELLFSPLGHRDGRGGILIPFIFTTLDDLGILEKKKNLEFRSSGFGTPFCHFLFGWLWVILLSGPQFSHVLNVCRRIKWDFVWKIKRLECITSKIYHKVNLRLWEREMPLGWPFSHWG